MKKYPICAQTFIQPKFNEYYQQITNNSRGFDSRRLHQFFKPFQTTKDHQKPL